MAQLWKSNLQQSHNNWCYVVVGVIKLKNSVLKEMAKLSCLCLEQCGDAVRPSDCGLIYNSSLETHNYVACTVL